MWARTRRMRSARTGRGAAETMGCLVGGHQRLIDALAEASSALGVEINCGVSVDGLVVDDRVRSQGRGSKARRSTST